jgi:hypothetical protein
LSGQCRRSGGGLEYSDYEGFQKALTQLTANPSFGRELGEQGRRFVRKNYAWSLVERKYLDWANWICRQAA